MTRPAVDCANVVKTLRTEAGSVRVLDGVSLRIEPGELAAVIGRSGSGKSTLLRLIAAFAEIDAGSIAVGGRSVAAMSERQRLRLRRDVVGYVSQRPLANLVPQLTVHEHVAGRVSLARELGLEGRLSSFPAQLSGGEQARASLATCLARRTPIVVVDEPTAELDLESAALVIEALRRASVDGTTVVVATHDPEVIGCASATIDLARAKADVPPRRRACTSGREVLRADSLVKHYGSTAAVDRASVTLDRGEIGAVIGRSGSGKSTLMMLLGRWIEADAGTLALDGVPVTGPMPWDRVGYVAQRFGLLPELSIRENVAMAAGAGGRPRPERVAEVLAQLDLTEAADRRPGAVSIGQQQRAAIARAIVLGPTLLLADEPTSHQDAASAGLVWRTLAAAADAGTACLVATHDATAVRLADRSWAMSDGHVSAQGR